MNERATSCLDWNGDSPFSRPAAALQCASCHLSFDVPCPSLNEISRVSPPKLLFELHFKRATRKLVFLTSAPKMDLGNILDLLLSRLSLEPTTAKFTREVFREILISCKSLTSSKSQQTGSSTKICDLEDTAAKLREVIAFFNSADDDRDEFLVIFPEWETKRKRNISKLGQTAESVHDSRQICNVAQIVGGSVGAIGGLAIIGSILFPPAAAVLLPNFLLPAATALTSSLAVGGSIATGLGSVTQVVTSVSEATILSNRIEEAKQICLQDKESFERLTKWFERTHQLETALDHLFGTNILDIIFRDLKDYFGSSNLNSTIFRCALTKCVGKILDRRRCLSPSFYDAAVTAVTFSVFLVRRRNRCLFQCVILTHKLGFGLTTAFNAKAQFGRLVASTVMKKGKGKLIGKAIASKVAVGAFAGIGIALDIANIALNSDDLEKGSKSEVQEKILEVAVELQNNLDFIRDVYRELRSAAKKASEEFFNSLVDQLEMGGPITRIAHEVYQDVLQETRILRVYSKLHDRKRVEKQEKEIQQSPGQIEHCTKSLHKVIHFFNEADKERAKFLNNFPQWENKRKENISHLHLIAESLQETRKLRSLTQQVGLIGGGIAIGAGLLHMWLPYVFLPILLLTAVVVTSTLAINIFNGNESVAQLQKRIEESTGICKRDQEEFDKMVGWFRRTHELDCAFDELFGSEILNFIIQDLRKFCGGGLVSYRGSSLHASALKSCVNRVFSYNSSHLQLEPSLRGAAFAVVLAVLLDQQRNLSHLNSFNLTHRMGIVKSRSRDCRWTLNLTKHTDEEESVLQMLATVLFNGRGIFCNTIHVILKLTKKDEDKIYGMAGELQNEINFMKKVYNQLS